MTTTEQNTATTSSSTTPSSPPDVNLSTKPTGETISGTTTTNAIATQSTENPFVDATPEAGVTYPESSSPEHHESFPNPTTITAATTSETPDIANSRIASTTSAGQPQIEETPVESVDPRIAALRAMFPTFDDLVLQSVLESVNWNQDRAIDALLGMSDPEYKSEARTNQPPVQSQTDLDEQFARQLMLEEQQAQQAAWQAAHPAPPGGGRRPVQQAAYQNYPQPPSGGPSQGGQIAQDLQEQFNRVAEAGKKTFGTIFSKVKAKIQEFDAPRPNQQSSTQPTWGASSPSSYPDQPHDNNAYFASQRPSQPISPAQQPAYYDPNPHRSPSPSPHTSPIPSASPPPAIASVSIPPSSINPPAPATGTTTIPSQASTTDTSRSAPATGAVPIDGGKIGLLPKRPVSLLRPSNEGSGAPGQIQRKESEDDELEYVENPFEEGNRK